MPKMKRFPLLSFLVVVLLVGLAAWICLPKEAWDSIFKKDSDTVTYYEVSGPEGDPEFDPDSLSVYDQKDPRLVELVRQHYISKPSGRAIYSSKARKEKKGFFVETGVASDYHKALRTMDLLEKKLGWNGLVVECHPEVLSLLRRTRSVFISKACLSQHKHPAVTEFTFADRRNRSDPELPEPVLILPPFSMYNQLGKFQVQTIPLYTLLAAVNVTKVDVVRLYAHGLEYEVLSNFPFDKILVKSWVVDVDFLSPEVKTDLAKLMVQSGYLGPMPTKDDRQLFVHKSVAAATPNLVPGDPNSNADLLMDSIIRPGRHHHKWS